MQHMPRETLSLGGSSATNNLTILAQLHIAHETCVPALFNSGATVNLIDHHLDEQLQLPTLPCITPLRVTARNNRPIEGGYLMHQTTPVFPSRLSSLQFGLPKKSNYFILSPSNPIILSLPWLHTHDPQL